jgi:hypothetical protein
MDYSIIDVVRCNINQPGRPFAEFGTSFNTRRRPLDGYRYYPLRRFISWLRVSWRPVPTPISMIYWCRTFFIIFKLTLNYNFLTLLM